MDFVPLDIFDLIARQDPKLYYNLALGIPSFGRDSVKRVNWWMNWFGVIKTVSKTPPRYITSDKIWKEVLGTFWKKRRVEESILDIRTKDNLDITEYIWTKDNCTHRENGPAYICNVVSPTTGEKCRFVFWATEGLIGKEEGFARVLKGWEYDDLVLHVEHGGWADRHGSDSNLVQARKKMFMSQWHYDVYWSEELEKQFRFSDDNWYVKDGYGLRWRQIKFADVSKSLGWKDYFKRITTTEKMFERLTS